MTKKIILFGAGNKGHEALNFFGTDNVYCFTDNYKFGEKFYNKDVISFGELLKIYTEYNVIISTKLYQRELSRQLQDHNIPYGIFSPGGVLSR